MFSVDPGTSFASWRAAARPLLDTRIPPTDILWETSSGLFASAALPCQEPANHRQPVKVPAAFMSFAATVACHCDDIRWALLYRILWRITHGGERHLLSIASDPDMAKARALEKNVRREIHKMHAFVRFNLVHTDAATGRERYAAWFQPDHFIIEAATPFFRKRFANMDWSILTPHGCAHWDGVALTFTPGITQNPIEDADALESAWLTYYRSIFNPARLKVKAMQTEMPKRYWKNLPEAGLIQELIATSHHRVEAMLAEPLRPVKPQLNNEYLRKLRSPPGATE